MRAVASLVVVPILFFASGCEGVLPPPAGLDAQSQQRAATGCQDTTYAAATLFHSTGGATAGGWNLWSNGYLSTPHDFAAGQTTLSVMAAGQQANNVWPHMVVSVGASRIGDVFVTSPAYAPYRFTFNAPGGIQELRVQFDNDFYSSTQDRNLLVQSVGVGGPCSGDTTPPAVAISAPAAGAVLSGAAVFVVATATDDVGVASVQFLLDGTNLGSAVTAPPWAVAWNTATAANASHTLAATARDGAGNTTTSAGVAVTVNNGPVSGDAAQYNFEGQNTQGWIADRAMSAVGSAGQTSAGSGALSVTFRSAGGTQGAYVQGAALPAGAVVTFHVLCPSGAGVAWVQPYLYGPWVATFRPVPSGFTLGQWNTLSLTAPSGATELGVQFGVNAGYTGSCLVDSVGWPTGVDATPPVISMTAPGPGATVAVPSA